VEMDLGHRRYETFAELYGYCYRVAAVIGLITIEICGHREPSPARDFAIDLGVALQLTNILRDIKEDSVRDRIYVPLEDQPDGPGYWDITRKKAIAMLEPLAERFAGTGAYFTLTQNGTGLTSWDSLSYEPPPTP